MPKASVWRWPFRLDPGLLVAIGLALIAAGPFFTRAGLPHGTDAELHVYRAAELGQSLREGSGYVRWAPDLYLGYGYPIFNYYAPFTYYLASAFDLVPGIDVVTGVKAVFVLGLVLAAVGSYLLGRDVAGPEAGVLAAALYTFSPYIVLIDPHARGDLAEHFGICLLPLLFYGFHRLFTSRRSSGPLLLSVLSLSVVILSHNLIGPIASGMIFAYWVWMAAFGTGRARTWRGPGAFVLAGAITGFFWLPALLEHSAVRLSVVGPGHFDFHQHFLSLVGLLAPSPTLDLGASAPQYAFNLGLAQWVLALVGVSGLAKQKNRKELWFFVLSGLVLIVLMLPGSARLWEIVPGMAYIQFPWRLLGPADLMLSVCGASSWAFVKGLRRSGVVAAALLALILGLALPVLYPPMWNADFGGTKPQDIIHWELSSQALGTTSTGDFIPQGAALVPMKPVESLISSYSGPGPIDKVNRASLPQEASVVVLEHGPVHDKLLVTTSERFVLRFFTFYFPGWRAYIDGENVPVEIAEPEGFITVRVPAGQHEVLVRFEDTPPRQIGWIITALGLVGLVVAFAVDHNTSRLGATAPDQQPRLVESSLNGMRALAFLGTVLLFAVVKTGLIDPHDGWLRYTSPPGEAFAAEHKVHVDFNNEIELLGYTLPKTHVDSGGEIPLVLFWRAMRPISENYQSFVHLAAPINTLWGQEDHRNPGGFPTKRWEPSHYVWDTYELRVLPGTPPGEYKLNVGLYLLPQGWRLPRIESGGQVSGDSFVVDSVTVERPSHQPGVDQLDMNETVMIPFPDCSVTLLGFSLPGPSSLGVSRETQITLFWRAEAANPTCQYRRLVVTNTAGETVARADGVPAGYPMSLWHRGDVVRDPVRIVVEEALPAGTYNILVSVGSSSTGAVQVGNLRVTGADAE